MIWIQPLFYWDVCPGCGLFAQLEEVRNEDTRLGEFCHRCAQAKVEEEAERA